MSKPPAYSLYPVMSTYSPASGDPVDPSQQATQNTAIPAPVVLPGGYPPTAQSQFNQPPIVLYIPQIHFGDSPQQATCPYCNTTVITEVEHHPDTITWLIASGICLLGFWAGCCLIPFCVDTCQEAEHHCPDCGNMVGRSKKLGSTPWVA